jgi:predicted acetyltransferase
MVNNFKFTAKGEQQMGENVKLVKPNEGLRDEYLDFYREWKSSGEDMVPWVIKKDPSDFEGMIQSLLDAERRESTGRLGT